ncbi:MAG: hypothetical protein JNK50_01080 [Bacteroidia bacterium]|nr:hypothetical protein [Bacteroidia bacterium]
MENFILSRKKIALIKDKVFVLSIPVSLNPADVVFIIESKLKFEESVHVEFVLKTMTGALNDSAIVLPVEVKGPLTRVRPCDIVKFEHKTYLLFSVKASNGMDIELSVESK